MFNADMQMMSQLPSGSRRGGGAGGGGGHHGGGIHDAATIGDLARLKELLDELPNQEQKIRLLESHNGMGRTPISCAAYNGHVRVVKYLMKYYPDSYNARDRDMSYPVHQAYLGNNLDVLQVFCSHRYSNQFKLQPNHFGETIVDLAARDGRALPS